MKILSLHVENFGILHDVNETFSAGLNTRIAPNGQGKSTLAVFIKAMLYGLPVSTRRSLIENERKRYTPWQGGAFGGSMDIEVEGKAFRIERLFGAKEADDTLTVLSLDTGRPAEVDWAIAPGEKLLGVDMAAYERSTYLSQRPTDKIGEGKESIHQKLDHLIQATADQDLSNYEEAMDALDTRARYYRHARGNGGAIPEQEQLLHDAEERRQRCQAAALSLAETRARIDTLHDRRHEIEAALKALSARETACHRAREAEAMRSHARALEREIADLRTQIEALRQAFGGRIPDEALGEQLNAALGARDDAARRAAVRPYTQEQDEYAALHALFLGGAPSGEQADGLRAHAAACARAALLAEQSSQTEQDALKERARRLRARRLRARRGGRDWLYILIAALLSAAALVVFWPVGLVLGLGTVIWAVVLLLHRKKNAAQLAEIEGQLDSWQDTATPTAAETAFRAAWRALTTAPEPVLASDAPAAVEVLLARAAQMTALDERTAKSAADHRQAEEQLALAEAQLNALLDTLPGAPRDGARALIWMSEQKAILLDAAARYERKKSELADWKATVSVPLDPPSDAPAEDEAALAAERAVLTEQSRTVSEELLRAEQDADRQATVAAGVEEAEEECARAAALLETYKTNHATLLLAAKYLTVARSNLSGRYLTTMKDRFSHYMATLTGTDAPTVTMNDDFRVKVRAGGVGRDTDAFSVGVRDLIALCERLALLDALFPQERPFLVLDDPFTNLDNDTIARASALLAEIAARYQVLYLTCHTGRLPTTQNEV